jgi:hypothetical protein
MQQPEVNTKYTDEIAQAVAKELTQKLTVELTQKLTQELAPKIAEELTQKLSKESIQNIAKTTQDYVLMPVTYRKSNTTPQEDNNPKSAFAMDNTKCVELISGTMTVIGLALPAALIAAMYGATAAGTVAIVATAATGSNACGPTPALAGAVTAAATTAAKGNAGEAEMPSTSKAKILPELMIKVVIGVTATYFGKPTGQWICNAVYPPQDEITVYEYISKEELHKLGYHRVTPKSAAENGICYFDESGPLLPPCSNNLSPSSEP